MVQDFRTRDLGEGQAPEWSPPPAPKGFQARIQRHAAMGAHERHALQKRRLVYGLIGCALLGILYVTYLYFTLPDISDPRTFLADQSSVIVDRNGTELYRLFGEEDRTYVEGNKIPKSIKDGVIAIEDARFYTRGCIDFRAVARAVLSFGRSGGASTLTRQLARNALDLKQENLISRKLKEMFLGCSLEHRYSKEELLDLYLNWIPFGNNAYGVEQASRAYFGKSASGLTLAQSAVLAALPQRPSYFSPYGKHVRTNVTDAALARILRGEVKVSDDLRDDEVIVGLVGNMIGTGSKLVYVGGRTDQVLRNMREMDMITEEQEKAALKELTTLTFQPLREDIRAAHFVLWVKQTVDELLGQNGSEGILDRGGLRIETTLDWNMQQKAETAVRIQAKDLVDRFGAHNAALVALDPVTREVLAYVGNTDYNDDEHDGKVDMARAARQPGSTFKPFIYSAAFREGYGPATVLYDVETKFGEDIPQNFDATFRGLIDARHALAGSRNIPAIKAFYLLPQSDREDVILNLVTDMGAPTPQETKRTVREAQAKEGVPEDKRFSYGYPLAIGAAETPLMDMVQGYATLADGGQYRPVVAIRRILDRNGSILYQADPEPANEVLDPRVAYQVTSILSDVSARPNEYWQTVLTVPGWDAAAKTGTSNKCLERIESGKDKGQCKERRPSDVWTIGYTPAIVAGVWVGNADGTALSSKAESLITAAPIWKTFMGGAHTFVTGKPTQFRQPDGIVVPQVSALSGQLPTECTPIELRHADVFTEDNAPSELDPACAFLEVDKVTGLLASESCPAEAREKRAFLVAKSVLADRWPLWQAGVDEWAKKHMELWLAREDHSGSLLPLPLAPTDACDIRLTPGRMTKPTVRFSFPTEGSIVPYPAFRPDIDVTSGSPPWEIRYVLDERPVGSFGSGTAMDRHTITVPRSMDSNGMHTLEVTVTDQYFNQAKDRVTFRFQSDDDPPKIRITSPSGALSVPSGSTITIRADAGDGDGGLKYVQFYLGTRLLTTKPSAPFDLEYAAEIRPGEYELKAVATDLAGNTAEDSVHLTVTP